MYVNDTRLAVESICIYMPLVVGWLAFSADIKVEAAEPPSVSKLCIIDGSSGNLNDVLSRCVVGDSLLVMNIAQGPALMIAVAGLCDLKWTVVTYSNATLCVYSGIHEKR